MGFMMDEVYLNESFNLKEFLENTILAIETIRNV
jgi:hypothetical protein